MKIEIKLGRQYILQEGRSVYKVRIADLTETSVLLDFVDLTDHKERMSITHFENKYSVIEEIKLQIPTN